MQVSRAGACLALLYVVPAVICVVVGLCSDDYKSRYVWFQIPVALQMAALHSMGLLEHFAGLTWAGLYLLACFPLIAGLYGVGYGEYDVFEMADENDTVLPAFSRQLEEKIAPILKKDNLSRFYDFFMANENNT